MNKVFIPKDDQTLPDSYKIKVFYVNGKSEELELASHRFAKDTQLFECWTKDDLCNWIVMANVQRLEFDKNFSKMVAIKQEIDKKVGNEK